jgi:hypothetical protein
MDVPCGRLHHRGVDLGLVLNWQLPWSLLTDVQALLFPTVFFRIIIFQVMSSGTRATSQPLVLVHW